MIFIIDRQVREAGRTCHCHFQNRKDNVEAWIFTTILWKQDLAASQEIVLYT